jgi:amino acid adenylation domain-containing protein
MPNAPFAPHAPDRSHRTSVARLSSPGLSRDEALAIEDVTASTPIAPPHETFLTRFERYVASAPEALAVRFGDQRLSYAELDARATQLAALLVARGVRRERAVAVCLKPSLEVAISIVAIFKAEGVYVPLDPSYPHALLASIVAEVEPVCVLTDSTRAGAELPESLHLFRFDCDQALLPAPDEALRSLPVRDGSLSQSSHIFYTSGTTGKPKGVLASQENLAHYLRAARDRYAFGTSDAFISLARYTFSISLFELLSPLACGASLTILAREEVLDPARLCAALAEVTVVHAGPSLLTSLVRYLKQRGSAAPSFAKLRHLSSGGDLVPPHLLGQLKETFRDSEIFVIYGCTEVSCMGATYEVSRTHEPQGCLVGKAFDGVALRVLDAHGKQVDFDTVGEIYFAGFGISKRYLKRPDLTSERFVAIGGQRLYRTGDLGRIQRDGNLEILGRSDFQVQVRGMRVELPGIEHTIRRLGFGEQCAVVAAQHDENDVRLCAFVVGAPELDVADFRKALARELPDYMVPQKLIVIEALPLTANGKLDRKRLIELARESASESSAYVAPEGDLEQAIADAFASVLGVELVSVSESFFDLGGHSLLAVMLLEELKNRLGLALSPELIFEHSSVRALASVAADPSAREQRPILLSRSAEHAPVFALLGVHLYKELARALEGKFSVYGVFAGEELTLLGTDVPVPSVTELAQTYLTLIRRTQPHGPYRLVGMSFGGIVAYEVAQQLLAAGEDVEVLGMLDSVLPETRLAKLQRLLTLPGRELASELSGRVQSRFGGPKPAESALFVRESGDARLDQLEEQRQAAYRIAARNYRSAVRPYAQAAFLVVSGERLKQGRLQDPRCGFGRLVSALDVRTADCDHLGILEKPSVDRVADLLISHAATRAFTREQDAERALERASAQVA